MWGSKVSNFLEEVEETFGEQNCSNFDLGPKNSKSPTSKTFKSTFLHQNSIFSLDFVLGTTLGLYPAGEAAAHMPDLGDHHRHPANPP